MKQFMITKQLGLYTCALKKIGMPGYKTRKRLYRRYRYIQFQLISVQYRWRYECRWNIKYSNKNVHNKHAHVLYNARGSESQCNCNANEICNQRSYTCTFIIYRAPRILKKIHVVQAREVKIAQDQCRF